MNMDRAGAAVVLAFAVCCLLVAPAVARWPVQVPGHRPDAVDREAAAEKLLPKPVEAADAAAAADQATAIAVPEEGATAIVVRGEERPQQRSSLLCSVFRCGAEQEGAGGVAVAQRGSAQERRAQVGWTPPAVAGTAVDEQVRGEDTEQAPHDSDSDSDSDCDSDDEDEAGIVGWFWRLVDGF